MDVYEDCTVSVFYVCFSEIILRLHCLLTRSAAGSNLTPLLISLKQLLNILLYFQESSL